jgi:putative transposase
VTTTHARLLYHFVFSTKAREPRIKRTWQSELHEFLGGCVRTLQAVPLRIGGVEDHVHMLVSAHPTHAPADLVREIKKASANWVQRQHDPRFRWQRGYGAFSVSGTQTAGVIRYIENQEEHHRHHTFQEEYVAFLRDLEIEFDERYLW